MRSKSFKGLIVSPYTSASAVCWLAYTTRNQYDHAQGNAILAGHVQNRLSGSYEIKRGQGVPGPHTPGCSQR